MAQFMDSQAKEGDKELPSGGETFDEEEEERASDREFIAPENTPEKWDEMSELERMDAKLDLENK